LLRGYVLFYWPLGLILKGDIVKVLEISTRKGGAGVTTVACAIALALSKKNPDKVLLVDTSANADTLSILGYENRAQGKFVSVSDDNLTVVNTPTSDLENINTAKYEFIVIDAGKTSVSDSYLGQVPMRVAVVRNSYLYLRAETLAKTPADAVVSLHSAGHALTHSDVENVLNSRNAFEYPVTDAQARAIDAGLFVGRRSIWEDWVESFIKSNELDIVTV
jgi:hypothetical protein